MSRNRHRAKVLLWDGTGLCVYAKRLERGRFASQWQKEGAAVLELTMNELQLFLEGSTLVGRVRLSSPVLTPRERTALQKCVAAGAAEGGAASRSPGADAARRIKSLSLDLARLPGQDAAKVQHEIESLKDLLARRQDALAAASAATSPRTETSSARTLARDRATGHASNRSCRSRPPCTSLPRATATARFAAAP